MDTLTSAALAGIAAPEAFAELCRDELSDVDVAADGWDIRARWFGVVICAGLRAGAARADPLPDLGVRHIRRGPISGLVMMGVWL